MGQTSKQQPEYKPIRVDVTAGEHRQLKSALALEGMTITEWLRRQVKEFLENNA